MKIKIKKLRDDAVLPSYATEGAAGFDFHCVEDFELEAQQTILARTGLSFEVPKGFELQVRPRSGLSLKTSLRVANSPGTVDSDYRGEVCIILTNTSSNKEDYVKISKGDRIAQGVVCPVIQAEWDLVSDISETKRGEGGFGSTGKN